MTTRPAGTLRSQREVMEVTSEDLVGHQQIQNAFGRLSQSGRHPSGLPALMVTSTGAFNMAKPLDL